MVTDLIPLLREDIEESDKLLTFNEIFLARLKDVGAISVEDALDYGLTGPCLRACGLDYDLRKQEPYSIYDRFEFEVPVGLDGDSWDRHYVRVQEMYESLSIVEQAVAQMPGGGVASSLGRRLIRPPAGEIYVRAENPRGEIGVYLVSDGTDRPYRGQGEAAVVLQPIRYSDHAPGRLGGRLRGDSGFFGHCAGRGGPVSDHLVPAALVPMAVGVTGILWDTLALLVLFVALSIVVLSLVWLERKVLGRLQRRLGPTRTGPHGAAPTGGRRGEIDSEGGYTSRVCGEVNVLAGAGDCGCARLHDLGHYSGRAGRSREEPGPGAALHNRILCGGYFGAGDGRLGIGQQICHPGRTARRCTAHQL